MWALVRDRDFAPASRRSPATREPSGREDLDRVGLYYRVIGFGGELEAFDTFTLTRRRAPSEPDRLTRSTKFFH